MKQLRITVHIDTNFAPEFFNILSNSSEIIETQLIDWSMTSGERGTILYRIDGDHSSFAERATSTPGIDSVAFSDTGQERTYALVVMRPLETPMFDVIHQASTRAGFVIRKPIIYRDGNMYAQVVGDPEPLQRAFEDVPDKIDIQIDEIGRFRGSGDDPEMTLSDRQREAVKVALELGYYNQPRGATHENVAARLGCAPPTASNHLQKAEAKLIRTVMDEFAPGI
jgi:predicted DNA binding protein